MKKILFTIALSSITLISTAQKPFSLSGNMKGEKANGQIVKLLGGSDQRIIGSAVIKNNQFQITGDIPEAELIRMTIAPSATAEESTWKASTFYLDKGHIRLTGYIDSLPSYYYRPNLPQVKPIVEGSHAQSMADQLTNMNQKERKEISVLDQAYMTEYYGPSQKEQFNTERGIAILKAIDPLKKQIFERKWNFIKNNPQERVSLDEATYMIMGYGEETLSNLQMDELLTIFDPHWNGKKAYNDLKEMISKARATAIGAKIIDGPLVDQAGTPVQLLSIFPKDKKYILLEFWASWCGPCRGEIPHLRHTYNEWKDKGFDIVSISLDEKEKDWTKAMAEEHMTWNQYNAREGFDSQIAKSYDIQGIPYALLIDSEGRIIKHNMRGASLDQALTELLK